MYEPSELCARTEMKQVTQYIQSKYGKGVLIAREPPPDYSNKVKSVIPKLNDIMGVQGIPCGRLIEIIGTESSGKSTLCLQIAASFQRENKRVIYMDVEHGFHPQYAQTLGIELDKMLCLTPTSCEMALSIAYELMSRMLVDGKRSGINGLLREFHKQKIKKTEHKSAKLEDNTNNIGLIIIDSLAALIPESQLGTIANNTRNRQQFTK